MTVAHWAATEAGKCWCCMLEYFLRICTRHCFERPLLQRFRRYATGHRLSNDCPIQTSTVLPCHLKFTLDLRGVRLHMHCFALVNRKSTSALTGMLCFSALLVFSLRTHGGQGDEDTSTSSLALLGVFGYRVSGGECLTNEKSRKAVQRAKCEKHVGVSFTNRKRLSSI